MSGPIRIGLSPLAIALALASCAGKSGSTTSAASGTTAGTTSGTTIGGTATSSSGASSSSGSSGSGGTTGAGTTSGVLAPVVAQHHNDGARDGLYIDPAFTKVGVAQLQSAPGFSAQIQGPVLAQPLFLSQGTQGHDAVYVVTEQDIVYALDAQTGATLWQQTVGTPVPNSKFAPCGTIDPLGITGTPILDPISGTLYFDAMTLQSNAPRHVIFALSLADGSTQWQVDVQAKLSEFDSAVQNQRGALTIVNGTLYVPYGGLAGGCGNYHGWLVAVPLSNPTAPAGWHTGSVGGGIWGPSGVATDGTSLYVSTAENLPPVSPVWAAGNGEAIVRLTGMASFSGQPQDYFSPRDWYSLQTGYSQLGSSGVVLLDLPGGPQAGSTPSSLAFAIGKTSNAYLVDRGNLGGETDGVAFFPAVAAAWVEGALAAYATAKATYVAMSAPLITCPTSDLSVLKILPGNPPTISPGWCATQGGAGSPIASASQMNQDLVVWGLGSPNQGRPGTGILTAFDGDTGAVLAQSPSMPDLEHWISPIVANGRLYVAGNSHVYAYSLDGPTQMPPSAGPQPNPDAGPPASCLIPVASDQPDPCASFGLACSGIPPEPFGDCVVPGLDHSCQTGVGCTTGLTCLPLGADHFCEPACHTTADCSDAPRACSVPDGGSGGACLPPTCNSPLFSSCNGGTGECLPTFNADGTTSAVCFPQGASDGGCSLLRSDAGLNTDCVAGDYCTVTSGTAGACEPVCDPWELADGGPTCASGLTCVPLGAFGVCARPCTSSCPAGLQCVPWSETAAACLP